MRWVILLAIATVVLASCVGGGSSDDEALRTQLAERDATIAQLEGQIVERDAEIDALLAVAAQTGAAEVLDESESNQDTAALGTENAGEVLATVGAARVSNFSTGNCCRAGVFFSNQHPSLAVTAFEVRFCFSNAFGEAVGSFGFGGRCFVGSANLERRPVDPDGGRSFTWDAFGFDTATDATAQLVRVLFEDGNVWTP